VRQGQPDLVPAPQLGQLALAIALVFVVAFSEENIFRGYLMLRLDLTELVVGPLVLR
jgi:membrane protease YdiL (CAAX protease family)